MNTYIKPWDARLAALLIAPFRDSRVVTPNHFTTLRFLTGMASAWVFARGDSPNLAAWLYALSMFLDHTDGELARLSGKSTRFGHYYDLITDFLVNVTLFVGIGVGLSASVPGATWMGIAAGLSVAAIFQMRHEMEQRLGKNATRQPGAFGFEAEDVLYLLPAVTHAGILKPFLIAAVFGAPVAALIVFALYLKMRRP
jgi:phosphatidylglycerophosphate synthase